MTAVFNMIGELFNLVAPYFDLGNVSDFFFAMLLSMVFCLGLDLDGDLLSPPAIWEVVLVDELMGAAPVRSFPYSHPSIGVEIMGQRYSSQVARPSRWLARRSGHRGWNELCIARASSRNFEDPFLGSKL